MKRLNIIFFVICFFLLSHSNLSAQNGDKKIDSLSTRIDNLTSCVQQNTKDIRDLVNKTTDAELHKTLEVIEKDIYDRDHKLTMNYVNALLTVAGIVFALALGVFAISWYFSSKKWKDEFDKKIKEFSENADKSLKENLDSFKTKIDNKFNETEAAFYYHFAIKFFLKKNYEVAIEFFEPLYKTKEYRYPDVCFYLSRYFFHTKDYKKVTKYLEEALQSAVDNNKAYGIFYFLKEMLIPDDLKEDICNFLNNENSNSRDYYQNNTKELIKMLIDENCKEVQE